jgi:hypothetical protein
MLKDFRAFAHPDRNWTDLSKAEVIGLKLMDKLHKKKAPLNAYKELYEWHLQANATIKNYQTAKDAGDDYVGRETLLKRLRKRTNMEGKQPKMVRVRLPSSKEVVEIPCHDAADCLVSLLSDPRLKDDDFSFFNNDPLAPPPDDLDYIGDCITGEAYLATHRKLIEQPNRNKLLVGAIFYIDGAVTGQFNGLPVTALKMSLSCFTREARKKEYTWVTLGYVPKIRQQESRGKNIFKESNHMEAEDIDMFPGEGINLPGEEELQADEDDFDIAAQDFHTILSVILESWVELERTGFFWDLFYRNKWYWLLHIVLFTLMVKCDAEEGDMNCGRYKPRTSNIKSICRYCKVPTAKLDGT